MFQGKLVRWSTRREPTPAVPRLNYLSSPITALARDSPAFQQAKEIKINSRREPPSSSTLSFCQSCLHSYNLILGLR